MVKSKNFSFEVRNLVTREFHFIQVKILQKLNDEHTNGDMRNASYEPLRELMTPLGLYIVAQPNQEFIVDMSMIQDNNYILDRVEI